METVTRVTPDDERYPTKLTLYIKDEWGHESEIVIPKWKNNVVVEMLKKFISVNDFVSGQFSASDMIDFAKFTNPSDANDKALKKWMEQKISR